MKPVRGRPLLPVVCFNPRCNMQQMQGLKRRCLFVCLSVCPVEGHLACLKMDCSLFFKVIGTWQEREFTRYGSWPCVWERFSVSKTGGFTFNSMAILMWRTMFFSDNPLDFRGSLLLDKPFGKAITFGNFTLAKKTKWFITSCGWIWPRECKVWIAWYHKHVGWPSCGCLIGTILTPIIWISRGCFKPCHAVIPHFSSHETGKPNHSSTVLHFLSKSAKWLCTT